MKVKVIRDMRAGKYEVRFLLEQFTDEEIFLLSRYGPLSLQLPKVHWRKPDLGHRSELVSTILDNLPSFTFIFNTPPEAKDYIEQAVKLIKDQLDSFVLNAIDFVGETIFEVKAGEEIKRISEGARKALDRDSQEYKEIIEKNREAFEKLSKL